jgi:hypothetical protein
MQFFNQTGNIGGVILQVAIHRDDYLSGRSIKTGRHGCCLSEISSQPDYFHPAVFAGQQLHGIECSIGRTVIDQHYFVIIYLAIQSVNNGFVKFGNIFLLIEQGNNNAEFHPYSGILVQVLFTITKNRVFTIDKKKLSVFCSF